METTVVFQLFGASYSENCVLAKLRRPMGMLNYVFAYYERRFSLEHFKEMWSAIFVTIQIKFIL